MSAPELSDAVLQWLVVIGIAIGAIVKGAWGYLRNASTTAVKVMPGNHNTPSGANGAPAIFDVRMIQDIRDDLRVLRLIAEKDMERRTQEAHDRQLRERWEAERAREERRRSPQVVERYQRMRRGKDDIP